MAFSVGSGIWWTETFACIVLYLLTSRIWPHVELLGRIFYVEKLRKIVNKSSIWKAVDVPKRWFLHFYIEGLIVNTALIFLLLRLLVLKSPLPEPLQALLSFLWAPNNKTDGVAVGSVMVVLLMEEVQLLRRCYECLYISVFSKSSISIAHYLMGIILYVMFGACMVASVDLSNLTLPGAADVVFTSVGLCLFGVASLHQHRTMKIFAKLRRSHLGVIETTEHLLPHGGLFEYVACPHFLCEILIYLSMNIVLRFQHQMCLSIFVFVLTNQSFMSVMTHEWYKKNFRMYPKSRKALIPFVF